MEISQVIKIRDALKAGQNLPVIVYIDNLFKKIDESNTLQFTKWDDENGILYHYSLTDPNLEHSASNIGGGITVFASTYEMIQAMEVVTLPLSKLEQSIDSLGCIGDDFKQRIVKTYTSALNPNLINYTNMNINNDIGYDVLNTRDDYYAGRYTESFKETRPMAEHNAYAEKVAAEKANQNKA